MSLLASAHHSAQPHARPRQPAPHVPARRHSTCRPQALSSAGREKKQSARAGACLGGALEAFWTVFVLALRNLQLPLLQVLRTHDRDLAHNITLLAKLSTGSRRWPVLTFVNPGKAWAWLGLTERNKAASHILPVSTVPKREYLTR